MAQMYPIHAFHYTYSDYMPGQKKVIPGYGAHAFGDMNHRQILHCLRVDFMLPIVILVGYMVLQKL